MEIVFILVEPAVPENIGAAARALNTMGFQELRLVKPADHLNDDARKLAHGSVHILENATLFSTLAEAVGDLDFVIGTTAKKRNIRSDYVPGDQLSSFLEQKSGIITKCGLVFGREESGLTNEEIGLCDILSTIPIAAPYPSLNLAQAVMLYAYQLSGLKLTLQASQEAGAKEYAVLKKQVTSLLAALGISPVQPVYTRIFERLALLNNTDVHLLLSITERITPFVKSGEKPSGDRENQEI
ncbi:MAG: tRNA/rRNA methyltransferase [Chlorobi bacterium]|nr:tRNA/rRNA methyltransferase [Chlorobiota bacterium]